MCLPIHLISVQIKCCGIIFKNISIMFLCHFNLFQNLLSFYQIVFVFKLQIRIDIATQRCSGKQVHLNFTIINFGNMFKENSLFGLTTWDKTHGFTHMFQFAGIYLSFYSSSITDLYFYNNYISENLWMANSTQNNSSLSDIYN